MARVDLGGKKSGTLWFKKLEGRAKDSLLLEVSNTHPGLTPYSGRRLLFTHTAFGYQGSWLVCSDQLGDLYHLDLDRNKYSLVYRAGQNVTALCCCITRPSEVLVGLPDHSVQCIDVETGELVATLRGHATAVKSLSVHSSGRHLLAVSSQDCVLWDLNTFSRCRTLNGGQDIGVQDVFFQPLNNVIFTCFKDDSVHAWDSDTMEYLYHLPPPPPPPCTLHMGTTSHYRAFTTTQDGGVMVAGGKSPLLHVWDLSSQRLLQAIQLPESVRVVKQLLFLVHRYDGGTSKILGVLAQDGVLRWLDMESCRLLTQTGSHDQPLSHAHTSPNGRYLSALSERGNVLLYDVSTTAEKYNQSSIPVVKARTGQENNSNRQPVLMRKAKKTTGRTCAGKHQYKSLSDTITLNPRTARAEREGRGKSAEGEGEKGGMRGLDQGKVVSILKGYGEYPTKYRVFIWRSLLQLPGNLTAYNALLERGTHPAYTNLHRNYPIRSQRLARVLQRTLSVLAHWSPIFGQTDYLPGLAFPFVKLFQNNQLVTFELLATLLTNWCGNWFDYFPNPPLNLLAMVENCLGHHDPALLHHLISHNITSHHYAWPLMSTVFSEVLTRVQWLKLWDHAFSHPPGFLLLLITSLLTTSRSTLLHCTTHDDFKQFFHHPPSLDVGVVIQEAYRMQGTTPPNINPEKLLGSLVPLTRGTYPVFNRYPKFIVDYQAREREKIKREEEDYLRQRQGVLELERLRETRRVEEEAWFRQQGLLLEAEEQRRKTLQLEEARLTDQRARLMAMKREMQVKELKVIDGTRRDFLQHQQRVKEAQIRRLDDQIKKRVVQREMETKAALEETELKEVELERQRVQLQHQLTRCQEEMLVQLGMEESADERRHVLHCSQQEREREEEGERERKKLAAAQTHLATLQVRQNCTETLRDMEGRRRAAEEGERQELTQVSVGASGNLDKMREVEELTMKLGHTQLAEQLEEERELGVSRAREGSESPALAALQWSRRRDRLDRQEAELLKRVQGVREKVVSHMTKQHKSHDKQPTH